MMTPVFLRRALLAGALLLGSWPGRAQQAAPAARDTSFTVRGAYAKARQTNPGIAVAQPARPATVQASLNQTYCTVGAHALQLDVFQPVRPRRGGYPAVLLVHGGGWRSGERRQHQPMAEQLAARGFVTATAEYRLSAEAPYPAAVLDLKAAIRWLRANAGRYNLDTSRVAVWGFSAGGQLAALLGTTGGPGPLAGTGCTAGASSRVQAVVDVDGILAFIHPESGEGDNSKGPSAADRWFGASRAERPDLWEQASALRHVGPGTPPFCFINSGVARMHAGRDDFARQLDLLHIYHETHVFAEAPHPFPLFTPWFQPTLEFTAAFLKKVLR